MNGPVVLITYPRKRRDITENVLKAAQSTKQSINYVILATHFMAHSRRQTGTVETQSNLESLYRFILTCLHVIKEMLHLSYTAETVKFQSFDKTHKIKKDEYKKRENK